MFISKFFPFFVFGGLLFKVDDFGQCLSSSDSFVGAGKQSEKLLLARITRNVNLKKFVFLNEDAFWKPLSKITCNIACCFFTKKKKKLFFCKEK